MRNQRLNASQESLQLEPDGSGLVCNAHLPGDTSASDRYKQDVTTEPCVLEDGYVRVPSGPGLGVEPDADVLAELTTGVEQLEV